MSVDIKFVLLRFTADDGVVLQQEACLAVLAVLAVLVQRRQTGYTAAHDNQIVSRLNWEVRSVRILVVADAGRRVSDSLGVAVRPAVVADSSVTGPRGTGRCEAGSSLIRSGRCSRRGPR